MKRFRFFVLLVVKIGPEGFCQKSLFSLINILNSFKDENCTNLEFLMRIVFAVKNLTNLQNVRFFALSAAGGINGAWRTLTKIHYFQFIYILNFLWRWISCWFLIFNKNSTSRKIFGKLEVISFFRTFGGKNGFRQKFIVFITKILETF